MGGIVDYKEGNASTAAVANALIASTPFNTVDAMNVEASSIYYGYALGGAYRINDTLSLAAGVRMIDAEIEAESNLTFSVINGLASQAFHVDFSQHAEGWGGFAGVNISPSEKLNIGLVLQSNTRLKFNKKIDRGDVDIVASFAKTREDLPGLVGAGLGYRLLPNLRIDLNYTHFLEKDATWEGRLDGQGGSYDISTSVEYTVNESLKLNIGCRKSHKGIDPDKMMAESPELDLFTVSTWGRWSPARTWIVNFGLARAFFDSEITSQGVKYDKNVWAFLLGVQKKFY